MDAKELAEQFETITREVDWEAVRKIQGVRVDMNLKRNLLIRYLSRHEIKPVDIAPIVGLHYMRQRQLIYDIYKSPYSAYIRIERDLGIAPEEY